ncbi:MAG: arylsulfatase [Pseudomonadales bacterium]|nr:arylsulfatase [Pseudomonadales bacterium]MDG1443014.1 arylsulfatase [Pseudomonadales bacterium]
MSDIPKPTEPFAGNATRLYADSDPSPLNLKNDVKGAPNVLLVMLDDVGFGSCSTFGGPIPTPGVDKIAKQGLSYNQFHTTALCSPTRASLLTGRNHHSVHMGGITEIANSFPAYDSAIPPESATIAEILKQNGYSTGCFGKWHLTPSWEQSPAGPFDRWPTGMGFERFYGIVGAEASHWEPAAYDQTTPIEPHLGKEDYHFTEDLADKTIEWLQRQKASAPDKPFFCYFAPAAVHAPHHVAPEWIEKFDGQFDQGWDKLREEIFERQLELGVIPPGTTLTPRADEIPAWDDYPDEYKPVASRLMEVFSGFLAHTDAQVERVIDAVTELDCFDNTLVIYLTGDNGASAEGTVHGAWSAPSFQNGVHEDPQWLLEHMDDFGTDRCENHFNVGWAWALDSPFQWMKQVASHFGGTRNAMVLSLPDRIKEQGGLRSQFHHVIDVVPTILELVGIDAPEKVNGITQSDIQGDSMVYSFADEALKSTHETQYFEILGNRGIYHDGWIASCFHGRLPWIRYAGYEFDGPQEIWELYNIEDDFSQGNDLAASHPDKLIEMKARFDEEAEKNGVYPLRDASAARTGDYSVPHSLEGHSKMTYTKAHVRMPESSIINLKNASYNIEANIELSGQHSQGVIACQGGNMAGWSLYLDANAKPSFVYNWFGHEITVITASEPLPKGQHNIKLHYEHDGGFGKGGLATLLVNNQTVAEGRIDKTVPVVYSMSGETFDVGRDAGSAVGPYPHNFEFKDKIIGVTLERLSSKDKATLDAETKGKFKAGLSTQ